MPRIFPLPRTVNLSGNPCTVDPFVIPMAIPWYKIFVPMVASIAGNLTFAISTPLKPPRMAPTTRTVTIPIPIDTPAPFGTKLLITIPPIVALNTAVETIDKSIPPIRNASIIPRESSPISDICNIMDEMLSTVGKIPGLAMLIIIIITTINVNNRILLLSDFFIALISICTIFLNHFIVLL